MKCHKYTPEEHAFLKSFIPGHSTQEVADAYNKKFEEPITASRVKAYMANHRIRNGIDMKFKPGHVSHNKGMKGCYYPGCEKGWFKAGHVPLNHKPLGHERVDKDGYTMVKVREEPSAQGKHDRFVLKHRKIWEEHYGPIPEGMNVIFLDGNKQNFDINNLMLVSKNEHLALTRRHYRSEDSETTRAGVLVTRLKNTISKEEQTCK